MVGGPRHPVEGFRQEEEEKQSHQPGSALIDQGGIQRDETRNEGVNLEVEDVVEIIESTDFLAVPDEVGNQHSIAQQKGFPAENQHGRQVARAQDCGSGSGERKGGVRAGLKPEQIPNSKQKNQTQPGPEFPGRQERQVVEPPGRGEGP